MNQAPKSITIDEQGARRLMLAEAIETSDMQDTLLGPAGREKADRLALQSARKRLSSSAAATHLNAVNVQAFLRERAAQVLEIAQSQTPAVAALQRASPWTKWLAWASFVVAVIFGTVSDRIANPHRVDLLSLPLLAILAWNLVVYAGLIVSYLVQRQCEPAAQSPPHSLFGWPSGLRHWRRRSSLLQAKVTAAFVRNWYRATAALQAQRGRKTLHLAAAGWAFGIALSIVTRGLVVEYRVGWESTLLNADQVHAILRTLLLPATALFPFEAFTVQDVASLQFSNSASSGVGAMAGARWVYLYATLLAIVVILPRLMLAMYAAWRERALSRRVIVNLTAPYYKRLMAVLNPTRIQFGVVALREADRDALLRIMHTRPARSHAEIPTEAGAEPLMRTATGEALFLSGISGAGGTAPPPQAQSIASAVGWAGRAFGKMLGTRAASAPVQEAGPLQAEHDDSDALIVLVQNADDIELLPPLPSDAGKSVLLLVNVQTSAEADADAAIALCRTKARAVGLYAEVVGFNTFAKCWVQDPVLLDALARTMPSHKKESFARLADAWLESNHAVFSESIALIATQLLDAAREVEEVRSALSYIQWLISSDDRQADSQAKKDAMAAVVGRLQSSMRRTHIQLLRLHGIDDVDGALTEQPMKEKFNIQASVNAKEAGIAGAATGAASGASIDLVTGGMTLGMAAALGALIGGGAAFAGAAWKNRSTPAGTTVIQLGDGMLEAMTVAALMRYLALAHFGRRGKVCESEATLALWESTVVAALKPRKDVLVQVWTEARLPQARLPVKTDLVDVLEKAMQSVLEGLYPVKSR